MVAGLQDAKPVMSHAVKDRSVQEIIAAGRSKTQPVVTRPSSLAAWGLSSLSAGLLWASFTPVDAGPLAWIALVPLLILVRIPQPTRWMYTALFATNFAGQLVTLQWMRLGDPTMYIALLALAAYCALYFPVFVALTRTACHRWGVPLVVAATVLWTGMEYLRAHFGTGFAWYFLGHSQYQWLNLIQISDITGAYGVSFVVMMANASLAGLVSSQWLKRLRMLTPEDALLQKIIPFRSAVIPVVATVVVLGSVLGYGMFRRGQAEFQAGPRVALIQGNFVASLREAQPEPDQVYYTHARLTGRAVQEQPDVIVWPESMFPAPLLEAAPGMTEDQLRALLPNPEINPQVWFDPVIRKDLHGESEKAGAALIWGIHTIRAEPQGVRDFNSAVFVTPEMGVAGRYDKRHLVPFGEYLPLRNVLPFLQNFTPYGGNAGLQAGDQPAVFEYKSWRFAPVICFEDTVPHVVRTAAAAGLADGKDVDVLVNVTNDGWFHGSSELDQHLITAAFRAVECRMPMVRAVNTGISAIIDGDGAILEPDVFIDGDWRKGSDQPPRKSMTDPKTGRRHRQMSAALIDTVPLDNRGSLYVSYGDWFGGACLLCVAGVLTGSILRRKPRA